MIATILLAAALAAFPQWGEPRRVTNVPHEHLLASYFAIDSWSPNKRYAFYHSALCERSSSMPLVRIRSRDACFLSPIFWR